MIPPYVERNFVKKELVNWVDFNYLLKNHPSEHTDIIKKHNYIFNTSKEYKKEFLSIKETLTHKIKDIQNAKTWDVHIYVSIDNLRSFPLHFDDANNVIIQSEGKSRWVVPHYFDVILEPGDMVWIPKFITHCCFPSTKRISLSFTFWDDDLLPDQVGMINHNDPTF